MLELCDTVEVQRNESGAVFRFNCAYPHELSVELKEKDLKRLGRLFIRLGEGKKHAKWKAAVKSGELVFTFRISAEREGQTDKPRLCFGYSYYNSELEGVSDALMYYDGYDNTALLRFGNGLIGLTSGDTAVLYTTEGEV